MNTSETTAAALEDQSPAVPEHQKIPQGPASGPRFVVRDINELHIHSACIRHEVSVSAAQLSKVAENSDVALREPLVVTEDGTVIDGHARLELAKLQRRTTLPCLEYHLSNSQALEKLIQMHRRSNGLNDFSRIVLAMELEPELRGRARQNQSLGGQNKGSSSLTEASRLDVRGEIARIAGVAVGNVTKVKQILTTSPPEVVAALRRSDVSIHRAWTWCELTPQHQRNKLWEHLGRKGVRKKIRELVSRHNVKPPSGMVSTAELQQLLLAVQSEKLGSVSVASIPAPGRAIFVTEELLRSLDSQKELTLTCATSIP